MELALAMYTVREVDSDLFGLLGRKLRVEEQMQALAKWNHGLLVVRVSTW